MNKKLVILSLVFTAMIVLAYVFNLSILVLLAVLGVCLSFVFLSLREATFLLFYFSSFSYILIYNRFSIHIFLIALYIVIFILKSRNVTVIVAPMFLLAYCIIFSAAKDTLKLGDFFPTVLLLGMVFVCEVVKREDYKYVARYFLFGFVVSIIIGFFKDQIPMLKNMLEIDTLYIEQQEIQRYSGLSFDTNFFALTDCVLISNMLFGEKKLCLIQKIILTFLIIVGLFTVSKSYIIMLGIIIVSYILFRSKNPVKNLVYFISVVFCIALVERILKVNIYSLFEARLEGTDSANDLTTGRVDLWLMYLNHIFSDVKCILFGEGFNALSLTRAAHNTYIEFVYKFGVIGSFFWIIYFFVCRRISSKGEKKSHTINVTAIILFFGLFFLSAYTFQQFWCCIFIAIISPYMYDDDNITNRDGMYKLQSRKNINI